MFNTSTDSLQLNLSKIIICQNINFNGKEVAANGKETSELEIDIINGQNIPTNNSQVKSVGKEIALSVKEALQNQNEYDVYRVLFITEKRNGMMTQRKSEGVTFKSEEL